MILLLPLLTLTSLVSGSPSDGAPPPSLERLRSVKLLEAPSDAAIHPTEGRGWVVVPMDYARPSDSPKLRIFYRLMPCRGGIAPGTKAPVLVVVNGGPGLPSSSYRPYDFDDRRSEASEGEGDVLGALLTRFRILMVDQRGTPGHSSALDMSDPHLSPAVVARYFDSVHHALDLQEVIQAVLPAGEPFFVLAQSYGGMIGMRYLTLPGITRLPAGIVFASAVLPVQDPLESFLARRRAQRALNLQLRQAVPEIPGLLTSLGGRLGAAGVDPGAVNYLWMWLGRGPTGTWEAALRDEVQRMLRADAPALRSFVERQASSVDLLNYLLSAKELTPGHTDRTLAPVLTRGVPFEPWMLDEQWTLPRVHGEASWTGPLLDAIDRAPPALLPAFPPVGRIKELLARTRVLFTIGKGDAFVEEQVELGYVKRLLVPGRGTVRLLPGGHKAAFLPSGVAAIAAWAAGEDAASADDGR